MAVVVSVGFVGLCVVGRCVNARTDANRNLVAAALHLAPAALQLLGTGDLSFEAGLS